MQQAIRSDVYKSLMTAIFEKPKYWSNGLAVYEFMKHKYPNEVKYVVENRGCSCKNDDSQIQQFINYIEEELIKEKNETDKK